MKTRLFQILGVAALISSAAVCVEEPSLYIQPEAPTTFAKPEQDPLALDLDVDTALVNTGAMMEFSPQVSIFSAHTLNLNSQGYRVDYSSVLEGVPIFHASIAVPVFRHGDFHFLLNTQIGLGSVNEVFPIKFDNEPQSRLTDRVRLVWMPVSLSSEVRYSLPGIPFFQPSLTVGAGGHLMMQRASTLPDADFWIPHVFVRPALTFFDAATTAHWFGGFLFGVTWYQSVGKANQLQGTSFDLSLKFLL